MSDKTLTQIIDSPDGGTVMTGIKLVHKNARHDAIDKMLEIRHKWSKTHNFSMCDAMLDEITGAIMNLPVRLPNDHE